MRNALHPIQNLCILRGYPRLTSIVVNKLAGNPGDGYIPEADVHLSESQAKVHEYDWQAIPAPSRHDFLLAASARPATGGHAPREDAPTGSSPGQPHPPRYYILRAMGQSEEEFRFLFERDVVALGWGKVDLTAFPEDEAVARAMAAYHETPHPPARQKKERSIRFFKRLKQGDRLLIPFGPEVILAVSRGVPWYDPSPEALRFEFANQHFVDYVMIGEDIKRVARTALPTGLKERLEWRGVAMLPADEFAAQIEATFQPPGFPTGAPMELWGQDCSLEEASEAWPDWSPRTDAGVPDRLRLVRVRASMALFRQRVLSNFGWACAVCGLTERLLLDAAHVKPWREHPDLRADPANGIALCVLHHRAYDGGILSIDSSGKIQINGNILLASDAMLRRTLAEFHDKHIRSPRSPIDLERG